MKLPRAEQAVVDIAKLRDYCLSPTHPRGRYKARVFAATLGLTAEDAERLRDELHSAAQLLDAVPTERDEFGQRYVLDFVMTTAEGSATIRSAWIIRTDETFPRFVTCYIL